jgi:Restriction endonuclease
MSFAWVILGALGVLWILKGAASEMLQEEAKTRMEHLPGTLIRLAGLGLPKEMRNDTVAEWQAELASVLSDTDGLPLTRLLRGVLYAAGMFRAAFLIMREMSGEEADVAALIPATNCLDLTGIEFEHLLVTLFQRIPEFTESSCVSAPGDGGIDILAVSKAPLVGGQVAIMAKRYSPKRKVGIASVRTLMGSISYRQLTKGIIITTSGFTSAARQEAARFGIELYDGERLLWLLRQHLHREFTITDRGSCP